MVQAPHPGINNAIRLLWLDDGRRGIGEGWAGAGAGATLRRIHGIGAVPAEELANSGQGDGIGPGASSSRSGGRAGERGAVGIGVGLGVGVGAMAAARRDIEVVTFLVLISATLGWD